MHRCQPLILILILSNMMISNSAQSTNKNDPTPQFHFLIQPIPTATQTLMRQYTWQPDCPVTLDELAYINLTYWGFDEQAHEGSLIVHQTLSQEVVSLFKGLYDKRFPIEKMIPMYHYQGKDELAMAANNTSAFNCRVLTGHQRTFSQHSFGRAIDINPQVNPYVKGDRLLPKNARAFVDRTQPYKGKIDHASIAYRLFKAYGWHWGGDWQNRRDYHHFEKRINQ